MKEHIKRVCLGTLSVSILVLICSVGPIFSYLAYKGIIAVGLKTILALTVMCIFGSILGFIALSTLYGIGTAIDNRIDVG